MESHKKFREYCLPRLLLSYNTNLCSIKCLENKYRFFEKKTIKKNVPLIVAGPLNIAPVYSIGETTRREIRKERDEQ